MSEVMIKIENVNFSYSSNNEEGQRLALDNINLDINKGEFLTILGHNGSGKSTLAKLMNAIFLPTSGKVYVNGMDTQDETKLWNIRETAGMVFQVCHLALAYICF